MITVLVHVIVLSGLAVFLAWAIWDVSPQTSITNSAYFFSESWRLITGQRKPEQSAPQVTPKQLEKSGKHTRYIYK